MHSQISSKPSSSKLKYPPKLQTYFSLYIFYTIVLLIQILISIPFLIFRFLLTIYINTFVTNKSEYGSILNSWDTVLADDPYTTNPTNISIVTVLELEGKLTLDRLRWCIEKTLDLKIHGSCPLKRYAKLRQYPQSVMGYWFWKSEENFNLDEHLNVAQFSDLVSGTTVDTTTVQELHGQFLNQTFPAKKSPWYFTLIENCPQSTNQKCPKTLLVLKLHHSLADGISTLKLIVEGLGQTKIKTAESSQPVLKLTSFLDQLQYCLKVLIYLFPKLVGSVVNAHIFKQMTLNHPWRHNMSASNKSIPSYPQFSKEIPVEMLKLKIDNPSSSVSPTAVILTAITESIRIFLKNKEHDYDNIFLISSLPKPMHPSYPTNHYNSATITMSNFGENFGKALTQADAQYMSQRDDNIYNMSIHFGTYLLSVLPKPLRLALQLHWPFVTLMSNIAGNNVEFRIDQLPCKHFSLSANIGNSAPGVVFTIFSYKKLFRLCVMAKESILTKEESQILVDLVTRQIYNINKISLKSFKSKPIRTR